MKVLTYQPYSLYDVSGGSRILRRIFEGREKRVISLAISFYPPKSRVGSLREIQVNVVPIIRSWYRGPLRRIMTWLRDHTLRETTSHRVRRAAENIPADIIHILAHGCYCDALCSDEFLRERPLWVSFHDHYKTMGISHELCGRLWARANRCFVISPEMGAEYDRQFGPRNWEIITDGVDEAEIQAPKVLPEGEVVIYFGGLLHLEYYPVFASLADALDTLVASGFRARIVLRGTQELTFLKGRSFLVERRAPTLDAEELRADLLEADVLYLPIKFGFSDFSRFSLSTKMVGYLAAPGAILYHGPEDAAARCLLMEAGAAAAATSLDPQAVVSALLQLRENFSAISGQAKLLARSQFLRSEIQARFWKDCL